MVAHLIIAFKVMFPEAFVEQFFSFVKDDLKIGVLGMRIVDKHINIFPHLLAEIENMARRRFDVEDFFFMGWRIGLRKTV